MTADDADRREAEHLPRLDDAAEAPRDTVDLFDYVDVADDDEPLDLTTAEVTGPDRRLPGDDVVVSRDTDLSSEPVGYFRYDPETDDIRSDPPAGTRLENGMLVVDD